MFIDAEVRLDVGFNAAQARLANLARGGLLRHASDDAYRGLETALARVGPLGPAPAVSRLVAVRLSDARIDEDSAAWALRWEATGPTGALFPALDADIKLTRVAPDVTSLVVLGTYRPPLGRLGAGLDRAIMRRVALATIQAFTRHLGAVIADPAARPGAVHTAMLPDLILRPGPEMP